MTSKLLMIALGVLLFTVCATAQRKTSLVFPDNSYSHLNPTCIGSRLDKITLKQDMYVQYSEFVAEVPAMKGLSTCFWISLMDLSRTATALNYAIDYRTGHDNNVTLQYTPSAGCWSLLINGYQVYCAPQVQPLTPGGWSHHCHSWDGRTGEWSAWQGGKLAADGYNSHSIGKIVPLGGTMVTGQHQETLGDGMDRGEGIIGSVTLLHVSSRPLANARSPRTLRLVSSIANDCTAKDRGDVIGWLRTPRRNYGGTINGLARESCHNF